VALADGVDDAGSGGLLDYWAALGQHVEPPVDSSAVRLALYNLNNVVDKFSTLSAEESSACRSTCGEPALVHATAALQSWWVVGPHIMTVTAMAWDEVERSVVAVDFATLTPFELARLCCLVSAARAIDDAIGWLAGKPEWAGVITYSGSIQVPESTWLYADGDASEAWIAEVAAQLRRYVGPKARSSSWLQTRLSRDDGDRRGQLPGLLVCSWLVETQRTPNRNRT